jgi:hypothetical protein
MGRGKGFFYVLFIRLSYVTLEVKMTEDTELGKTRKAEATTHFKIISRHFPKGLVTAMKNVCHDSFLAKI